MGGGLPSRKKVREGERDFRERRKELREREGPPHGESGMGKGKIKGKEKKEKEKKKNKNWKNLDRDRVCHMLTGD